MYLNEAKELLIQLSLFPLILLFDAIYVPVHKTLGLFFALGAVHFVLFVPLNFLGVYFLYKPIDHAFKQKLDTPQARKRTEKLTTYSSGWIFLLGATYFVSMLILIFSFSLDTGDIAMEEMPANLWMTVVPSVLYIYAILPAFITYFLISNFILDLKLKVFSELKSSFPAGRKKIGAMLLLTFIILGFFPSILVIIELSDKCN